MINRGQHLIGKVLGSCVLEKLLGYGGTSAVFLAQQTQPERKVAVKVFLPRSGMDARMQRDFYRRFLREAEAASKLMHSAILPIYAYGEQDGLPYIVMPYMPGGTLADYMAKRGPLSLKEALWYLEQLTSALHYAHEQGCVHCDVKPANILLDSDGHVMLSDFGIARLAKTDIDPEQTEATNQEALAGTPDYISPEQALGRPVDRRTDIYSLGITLFFVLAKRLPFRADSTIALALQHVHEAPPSLALLRADIAPVIDRVVRKALAKDPADRFQSAEEFCTAFEEAIIVSQTKGASKERWHELIPTEDPFAGKLATPAAPKSVVRVRPLWRRSLNPQRIVIICAILLIVSTTFAFVVNAQLSHLAILRVQPKTAATVTPTPTRIPGTADRLTYESDWPVSSTFFFHPNFPSRYHVMNKSTKGVAMALYTGEQFSDFRLKVSMKRIQSSPLDINYYGIVFRVSSDHSNYYLLSIAPEKDGEYLLQRFHNGDWEDVLLSGEDAELAGSIDEKITLTIEARKNSFRFAINDQPFSEFVKDENVVQLKDGLIGLYVENGGSEVAFWDLYIEDLK